MLRYGYFTSQLVHTDASLAAKHDINMDCNAGKSLNSSKNRCFAHCADVLEDIKPFTTARWTTFLKSVDIWKDLVGNQADIATAFLREHRSTCVLSLPIPEFGGCHNTCYRYFTDSSKQKRGKISKEKQLLAAKSSHTSGRFFIFVI